MTMILRLIYPVLAITCLCPFVPPAAALVAGIVMAVAFGNPYLVQSRKLTKHLLSLSIIGLGAGMDLHVVLQAGLHGIGITAISIAAVLLLGMALGKLLHIDRATSVLVSIGTAICGGSAIAAAAPTIHAKDHDISVSLGVVFLLNAVALVIFPPIGHYFGLTQEQFGVWSALAIHDTSSVVGATAHYGADALEIGTTIKLTRALWIVPVVFLLGMMFHQKTDDGVKVKAKKPWFILGFVVMAAIVTWIPETQEIGHWVSLGAQRVLVMTLFLIGACLTRDTVKAVGIKPFIQGGVLWIVTLSVTLFLVISGVIV